MNYAFLDCEYTNHHTVRELGIIITDTNYKPTCIINVPQASILKTDVKFAMSIINRLRRYEDLVFVGRNILSDIQYLSKFLSHISGTQFLSEVTYLDIDILFNGSLESNCAESNLTTIDIQKSLHEVVYKMRRLSQITYVGSFTELPSEFHFALFDAMATLMLCDKYKIVELSRKLIKQSNNRKQTNLETVYTTLQLLPCTTNKVTVETRGEFNDRFNSLFDISKTAILIRFLNRNTYSKMKAIDFMRLLKANRHLLPVTLSKTQGNRALVECVDLEIGMESTSGISVSKGIDGINLECTINGANIVIPLVKEQAINLITNLATALTV